VSYSGELDWKMHHSAFLEIHIQGQQENDNAKWVDIKAAFIDECCTLVLWKLAFTF